jgi:subtilisin-like proprotein convertase family protein
LCAVLLAATLNVQAALLSYTWDSGFANGGAIPDDNPSGWVDTREVSTGFPVIESVAVNLQVSSEFNGDLYAYLSHGSGLAILLNRVGRTADNPHGYQDTGFVITLTDAVGVTTDIHSYGGNGGAALMGAFQSDGRNVAPESVLATDPRNARLSAFNGLNPNGNWTLFFADVSGGAQSAVVSWGLEIEAVPEPVNAALILFAGLAGFGSLVARQRRVRRHRSVLTCPARRV